MLSECSDRALTAVLIFKASTSTFNYAGEVPVTVWVCVIPVAQRRGGESELQAVNWGVVACCRSDGAEDSEDKVMFCF